MKILLVEDDALSGKIMKRALDRLGHHCVCVGDGDQAWRTYTKSSDFDVVISGREMPGMNGPELCARIRSHAKYRDAYPFFVFWTSLSDGDHVLGGARAGADYQLAKPLDEQRLEACLIAARMRSSYGGLARRGREPAEWFGSSADKEGRDRLVGLGNQLRLLEDLDVLSGRVERYGHSYSVILCGVDSHEPYNYRRGRPVDNDVLSKVAKVVLTTFRSGDTVYQYGARTFLIVLPEQSASAAAVAADRLREKVEVLAIPPATQPSEISEDQGVVTISIGLAESGSGRSEKTALILERAQSAFEEAQRQGGNRIEVHQGT